MFDIFRNKGSAEKKSKVLIVGQSGVGKTSLRTRFVKGNFRENELMTIGVEYTSADIDIEEDTLKLEIYDIAGQEAFQLQKRLFKNVHGLIIVFDLTRHETFFSVRPWIDKIYELAPKVKPPIIIVGNKTDLKRKQEIPLIDVEKLIETLHSDKEINGKYISFIETSAKTGHNIEALFSLMAEQIMEYYYN